MAVGQGEMQGQRGSKALSPLQAAVQVPAISSRPMFPLPSSSTPNRHIGEPGEPDMVAAKGWMLHKTLSSMNTICLFSLGFYGVSDEGNCVCFH